MNQLSLKEKILITIKRLGINGEGIGYYKRLAVFVEGALPGEEVEVEITKLDDKFAYGKIIRIKKKSSFRVEPKCPYFGKCGGCDLLHLDYKAQLHEKKNLVIEAFNRYFDGDVSRIKFYDCIGMDDPFAYRNKTSLVLRFDGNKVVSGLYAKGTNQLVYVDECELESEIVRKTLKEVLAYLTLKRVSIFNTKTHEGIIRFLIIRAFNDKDIQVTFVLAKEDAKTIEILKGTPVPSVFYSINSDYKSVEMFGPNIECAKGKKQITANLGELSLKVSPKSFFQLNSIQVVKLYDEIKAVANLTGKEKVLDCYCGIGSIGLYLASDALEVRGIDINKDGIKDAIKYAKDNGITNSTFYAGNIIPYLHQFKEKGFIPDVLIVDPPRKGLDMNFINYLKTSSIKKIVYVSCNPATLVKNLNALKKQYEISEVRIIDMFPNTAHVETIVLLTLKNQKQAKFNQKYRKNAHF